MADVTDRASRPVLYLQIAGVGPYTDAAGTADRHRLATKEPDEGYGGQWLPYLVDVPSQQETRLDLVTGEIQIGGLTLEIVDGSQVATVTDLFATREVSQRGWLAADATAAAATIDVDQDVGGIGLVDDVIHVGPEAMLITAVAAGGGAGGSDRYTVTRAYYGTTAQAHYTAANKGDAEVRWRPHYLKGRRCELWLNFDADGQVDGDAVQIGTYLLDGIRFKDGAIWELTLRGMEAQLDTEIGVHAYQGDTLNPFSTEQPLDARLPRDGFDGRDVELVLKAASGGRANIPGSTPYELETDGNGGGYLRLGDGCVEFDEDSALAVVGGQTAVTLTDYWVARSPLPTSDAQGVLVRQVLPTARNLPHTYFKPVPNGGVAEASDHPVDIFLCLCLSTGDGPWPTAGSNVGAGQTNYDVLPRAFGAGIPVANFDIAEWEMMRLRTALARTPNLVVGWDGPFNLLEWAQRELLGPLGVAAVQDETGTIRPVRITEVYPHATPTTLGTADIIPRSEQWDWSWADQVLAQTWEFDHAGPDGDPGKTLTMLSAEGRERYGTTEDRTLVVEARGLTGDSNAGALILARSAFVLRHFLEPPPLLTLRLNWHHLHLPIGEPVLLTHAVIPNPATGERGVTAVGAIVVSRKPLYREIMSGMGGGGLEVRLFWVGLDSPTLCLWGPSAEVAAGDAGTGNPVTVDRNEFSNGDAGPTGDSPVADDTDGFQTGGVGTGCYVILLDSDGAVKNANTPRVTGSTATTLTLSDVFRDALAVEVPRVAGDIIVHCGDTGATSYPAQAWTTYMQEHGAFVDAANETVGTTSRTAQYGD